MYDTSAPPEEQQKYAMLADTLVGACGPVKEDEDENGKLVYSLAN